MVITVIIVLTFAGCAKKCFTCGKPLGEKSFSAFGNEYCSECFMTDLGL